MIGLYIDLTKFKNNINEIKTCIIQNMPSTGIWYDSNNFWDSNILLFTCGNGLPARLIGFNNITCNEFIKEKMSCEIFGRTRISHFLKYVQHPYEEYNNRIKRSKNI